MPDLAPPTYEENPITILLPGESGQYSDNEAVRWMLSPWDSYTAALIDSLRNFYARSLDPLSCSAKYLDWLAQWAGYTAFYWDSAWPERVKRTLIAEAFTRVWPTKGSLSLIVWLFELFQISARILSSSSPFRADVSVAGDRVGGPVAEFHILLPLEYSRAGEWVLVRKLIALYAPIWIGYTVSYQESRADIMRAGELVTF